MSEVDNFISSVKEKRNESIEIVLSAMVDIGKDDEKLKAPLAALADVAYGAIDKAIGGVLDSVEEHYSEFITAETDSGEPALITCASDLSTLYFEEVSN